MNACLCVFHRIRLQFNIPQTSAPLFFIFLFNFQVKLKSKTALDNKLYCLEKSKPQKRRNLFASQEKHSAWNEYISVHTPTNFHFCSSIEKMHTIKHRCFLIH